MAEIDFMSVLHKALNEITWQGSMILNSQKQRLLSLPRNLLKTIGTVIEEFATEGIATLRGAGKK